MKQFAQQLISGWGSLAREFLCLQNSGRFLEIRLPLWRSICTLALLGLLRNILEVLLGIKILGKWYSLDMDINLTMMAFVVHFPLVASAVIHWTGSRLGASLSYSRMYSFLFCLQIVHLFVPFIDWIGFRLHLPCAFIGGAKYNPWFNIPIYMTLGIIIAWIAAIYLSVKVFLKHFQLGLCQSFFVGLITLQFLYWPIYHLFPTFVSVFNILTFHIFPDRNFLGYAAYFCVMSAAGGVYHRRYIMRED